MASLFRSYPVRAFTGLVIALAIGVGVVAMFNAARAIKRDVPMLSLWDDASISQVVTASAAFILLALLGVGSRRPWIVALSLTVGLWAFAAYAITRPYEGGGANIGLGILMIFSPLPIAGASLLSLIILRNRPSANEMADGS